MNILGKLDNANINLLKLKRSKHFMTRMIEREKKVRSKKLTITEKLKTIEIKDVFKAEESDGKLTMHLITFLNEVLVICNNNLVTYIKPKKITLYNRYYKNTSN